MECFGLEGPFRGHLAQPPHSEQGYLQLDQIAELHCLSEQYDKWSGSPLLDHPLGEKGFNSYSV